MNVLAQKPDADRKKPQDQKKSWVVFQGHPVGRAFACTINRIMYSISSERVPLLCFSSVGGEFLGLVFDVFLNHLSRSFADTANKIGVTPEIRFPVVFL